MSPRADVAAGPARDILAEALRLGGTADGAAAILAHSLAIAIDHLERASAAVSHGYVRAKAQKGNACPSLF